LDGFLIKNNREVLMEKVLLLPAPITKDNHLVQQTRNVAFCLGKRASRWWGFIPLSAVPEWLNSVMLFREINLRQTFRHEDVIYLFAHENWSDGWAFQGYEQDGEVSSEWGSWGEHQGCAIVLPAPMVPMTDMEISNLLSLGVDGIDDGFPVDPRDLSMLLEALQDGFDSGEGYE
jgi:hypothetical protein